VAIWNIHIDSNGTFSLPKTATGVTRTLYFYEGDTIAVAETTVFPNHGIRLDATQEVTITAGNSPSHLLMLQGKPIDEPVVKYGPFVMNTEAEIQAAMQEYKLTQFGGWPWRYPDHVHDKDKGRFAKYPNGTLVEKI
jgi:redox-sensitive bicupin YhaK (pirin superfamily)